MKAPIDFIDEVYRQAKIAGVPATVLLEDMTITPKKAIAVDV